MASACSRLRSQGNAVGTAARAFGELVPPRALPDESVIPAAPAAGMRGPVPNPAAAARTRPEMLVRSPPAACPACPWSAGRAPACAARARAARTRCEPAAAGAAAAACEASMRLLQWPAGLLPAAGARTGCTAAILCPRATATASARGCTPAARRWSSPRAPPTCAGCSPDVAWLGRSNACHSRSPPLRMRAELLVQAGLRARVWSATTAAPRGARQRCAAAPPDSESLTDRYHAGPDASGLRDPARQSAPCGYV